MELKTRAEITDVQAFYAEIFRPVEKEFGQLDAETLMAIIGFAAGGPVNLSTVGRKRGEEFVTYVSCELACYEDQKPSSEGPFELLMTCNDEDWAITALTAAGEMSLAARLDHGHSLDLGPRLDEDSRLQGIVFERFSVSTIGGLKYGILRAIGVTRAELEWCRKNSVARLIQELKRAGVYPRTDVRRHSVLSAAKM